MPEPSREAREKCFCIPCANSLGKRANTSHAPDECIARALDEFAEKVTQERDALRRRVAELEAAERWLEEHCPDDIVPLEDTHLSRVQFVLDHLLVERKVRGFTAFVLTGDEDGDVQRGAEDMKARADRADAALDEIAELDPEELGENDDEWGGAAVGARAQEIAEEARRGRGDG